MRWRTTAGLGVAAAGMITCLAGPIARAQGPVPGFGPLQGPSVEAELRVAEQFDADGNGWLDRAEREKALAFVEAQPARGRGGRGRMGGRGAPGAAFVPTPGPRIAPAEVPVIPSSVPFYDPATVRTLFVDFDTESWEKELMAFKNTDVEVPALLTVDGVTYRDVGMSFRGNSSFMMVPEGLKHSFNVTVDFVHDDQNVLGFRTLNLLNGNGDPGLLRGTLFQAIAGHYLPAARANFVRVVVNGEYWGVFVNVEQINRDFVEHHFDGENGTRWKVPGSPASRAGLEYQGDDPAAYRAAFEIKNKDNARSWNALVQLTKVLNTTPVADLEAALAPILDIDEVLRFLALDNVLVNSDGYWVRGSDYYLYLDEAGRFHVLPGDTNETFSDGGGRGRGGRGGRRGAPAMLAPSAGTVGAAPGLGDGGGRFGGDAGGGFNGDAGAGRVGNGAGGGFGPPPGGGGATLDLLVGLDDESKPLRSRLLAVPALRAKYLDYCRDIARTWLDWERLGPVAAAHHGRIAPFVATDTRKLASLDEFNSSLATLEAFVRARQAYVLGYVSQ